MVSARDTPSSSDPVPIAGDRGGVPGSSDPVSTAGNHTAINNIVAAARAAKVELPFSISQRQLSFQACTLLECVATLDCIA